MLLFYNEMPAIEANGAWFNKSVCILGNGQSGLEVAGSVVACIGSCLLTEATSMHVRHM